MSDLRVLHVLPHGGGGGERYIELLADRIPWDFETIEIASSPAPVSALSRMVTTLPQIRLTASSFDLVNVHGDTAALLSLPWLRKRPVVITTHGLSLLRRRHGAGAALVRGAIRGAVRSADLTICTSAAERQELEALTGRHRPARLVTVPNGVELPPPIDQQERRRSREALGLAEDQLAVLFVGELSAHKDPLTAVRAAERLSRKGLPIQLLLAGDGKLRASIEAMGIPNVHVLGHCEDARSVYAAGDILALPSIREGLSFVLLEAMSQGIPPIVSGGPGNAAVVKDTGTVVAVGDVSAFADAVEELWRAPEKRRRMGEAARRRVADCFTIDRVAEQVLRAYRHVLQNTET